VRGSAKNPLKTVVNGPSLSMDVHGKPVRLRVSLRVSIARYPHMPLTDARIRTTKPGIKPLKLADGGGLYLEVRLSGKKLWRYRYRIADKENLFAIGEYPEISLAEARTEHDKAR